MTTATIDQATIELIQPSLMRYARKWVGREDVAQDLVQETWAAAVASIGSFAGRSSLRTWLVSILRRKIVDMHRRKKPQVVFDESHVAPVAPPSRERIDDMAAVSFVHDELKNLPTRERQAVNLVDVKGMDRLDAATEMGINRNALRVLLHRGRHRIREKLEAQNFAL